MSDLLEHTVLMKVCSNILCWRVGNLTLCFLNLKFTCSVLWLGKRGCFEDSVRSPVKTWLPSIKAFNILELENLGAPTVQNNFDLWARLFFRQINGRLWEDERFHEKCYEIFLSPSVDLARTWYQSRTCCCCWLTTGKEVFQLLFFIWKKQ